MVPGAPALMRFAVEGHHLRVATANSLMGTLGFENSGQIVWRAWCSRLDCFARCYIAEVWSGRLSEKVEAWCDSGAGCRPVEAGTEAAKRAEAARFARTVALFHDVARNASGFFFIFVPKRKIKRLCAFQGPQSWPQRVCGGKRRLSLNMVPIGPRCDSVTTVAHDAYKG
jgi:hypothetical protein